MNLGKLCCNVSSEILYNSPNINKLVALNFHHLLVINFIKGINRDNQNKNIRIFWTNCYFCFDFCCNAWKIILSSASSRLHSTKIYQGARSGLRQFLATGISLKMMKNAFYFTSKAPFVLKIFKFLSWLFGHVAKQLH